MRAVRRAWAAPGWCSAPTCAEHARPALTACKGAQTQHPISTRYVCARLTTPLHAFASAPPRSPGLWRCLLYTSDAADDM
eukprot:3722570-Prymnesium_polylepis.1